MWASVLLAQGHVEQATRPLERAAEAVIEDDLEGQVLLHRARAKLATVRGEAAEAEQFAREAVTRAAGSDELNGHALALVDHADALELLGRHEEAARALRDALSLFERKGNIVAAELVRGRLSQV
jgi:tetratricopeptide (TPR) repeat protein